jgi:formate dehydrogenase (coenzyme F420) beta subunit
MGSLNGVNLMRTLLPNENRDPLPTLQAFLRKLLEAGLVDLLLVPMTTPTGAVVPALVSDPGLISFADPLAPVMPVNSATLAGKLSFKQPRPRVGAVLRACELRALVELAKMQQACLDDLLLIAVDCAGTYSPPTYQQMIASRKPAEANLWRGVFEAAADPGSPLPDLRLACKICEQPVFPQAQIHIELFGSNLERGIWVSLPAELGEKLELANDTAVPPAEREEAISRLAAARETARETEFSAIRERIESAEGIQGLFSTCIRCHNCMTVCPICYCKTCVFKSVIFDHDPMQYVTWAHQKGACRLPADTLLFHMTRLNHMALSCVGCGMCSEACPADLPVGLFFRTVSQKLGVTFDYVPGRSLEEPLPLVTFKADEWTEMGE